MNKVTLYIFFKNIENLNGTERHSTRIVLHLQWLKLNDHKLFVKTITCQSFFLQETFSFVKIR